MKFPARNSTHQTLSSSSGANGMKPDWRPERSISERPDLYVIEPETVKPRELLFSSFAYYFMGWELVARQNARLYRLSRVLHIIYLVFN